MNPFFVHPDISQAQTISTEVYNSQQVFEIAKEKIFGMQSHYGLTLVYQLGRLCLRERGKRIAAAQYKGQSGRQELLVH